jgi:hypothetical protein
MTTETATPVSPERLFTVGQKHPQRYTCPGCGESGLARTALVELAYVFTACDCPKVDYRHLYEQLWHQRCFRGAAA